MEIYLRNAAFLCLNLSYLKINPFSLKIAFPRSSSPLLSSWYFYLAPVPLSWSLGKDPLTTGSNETNDTVSCFQLETTLTWKCFAILETRSCD